MDAEIGRGLAHPFKAIVLQRGALPFSRFVREGGDFG